MRKSVPGHILVVLLLCSLADVTGQTEQAEDTWARALLLSVTNYTVTNQRIKAVNALALGATKNRAPIYVSLGDFCSTPGALLLRPLRSSLKKAREEGEMLGLPNEQQCERLVAELEGFVNNLDPKLSGSEDEAMKYYLAATNENPAYATAWFRVFLRSEGDSRVRAASQLVKADPENCLPRYLSAAAEVPGGSLSVALAFVKAGNEKGRCKLYRAPVPQEFRLSFPEGKPFKAAGVSGKLVTRSALAYLVEDQNWVNVARSWVQLDRLAQVLAAEGARLLRQGEEDKAAEYLEAVLKMSLHLVRTEPANRIAVVAGAATAEHAISDLKQLYVTEEQTKQLARVNELEKTLKGLSREFEKAVLQSSGTFYDDEVMKQVLMGELTLDKEEATVRTALREARLLK